MLERLDLTETESAAGIIYVESRRIVASHRSRSLGSMPWIRPFLSNRLRQWIPKMAVALQQAFTTNNNLTMRVQQPSGEINPGSVAANSGQIAQATIEGSVQLLKKEYCMSNEENQSSYQFGKFKTPSHIQDQMRIEAGTSTEPFVVLQRDLSLALFGSCGDQQICPNCSKIPVRQEVGVRLVKAAQRRLESKSKGSLALKVT